MTTLTTVDAPSSAALRHVRARLLAAYGDHLSEPYIDHVFAVAEQQFATAPVRTFVPIFVERLAHEMLDAADSAAESIAA
jgi:hypothetical protein